jgi:hypothetical protein
MGNYNKTYGSLGAIIVLLLWLYLMAYAVLFGAAMNAELERQTERDTTAGADQPMGERGAHVADAVGPTPQGALSRTEAAEREQTGTGQRGRSSTSSITRISGMHAPGPYRPRPLSVQRQGRARGKRPTAAPGP